MKILDVSSFEKLKINSISLDNFDKIDLHLNKYGITENDMIFDLKGFPVGVVVKMMEEQEKQDNEPNVKVFQKERRSGRKIYGFEWDQTEDGQNFWQNVISKKDFNKFYEKYPEYKKYDN